VIHFTLTLVILTLLSLF
jgi:hypothetical protein